jgi:hypothetical protein
MSNGFDKTLRALVGVPKKELAAEMARDAQRKGKKRLLRKKK